MRWDQSSGIYIASCVDVFRWCAVVAHARSMFETWWRGSRPECVILVLGTRVKQYLDDLPSGMSHQGFYSRFGCSSRRASGRVFWHASGVLSSSSFDTARNECGEVYLVQTCTAGGGCVLASTLPRHHAKRANSREPATSTHCATSRYTCSSKPRTTYITYIMATHRVSTHITTHRWMLGAHGQSPANLSGEEKCQHLGAELYTSKLPQNRSKSLFSTRGVVVDTQRILSTMTR